MKIICIGRNYAEHAAELKNAVPDNPIIFMKPSTALLTENRPFYHPEFSNNIHYELEVVLKIRKSGKYIREELAHDYFDQVGLGIDFTARDIQDICKQKGHPWEIAKAFDHSAAISDFYPLSDFDNESIKFTLTKNGHPVQSGDTKDLIFNFNYLISYISQYFTLQQGDLIFTGTPSGVGKVEIGDQLTGLLEGKPVLQCTVK
jgi:acylpyruvate hydrolase